MAIIDAFTFNSELDLLDLRLHELDGFVDRWVICEATTTHAGDRKPLYFEDHKYEFAAFLDRITHIVVDDLPPPLPDAWVSENYQRNQLLRGLTDAAPNDIVLVGDVDEIPDKAIIRENLDFIRPWAFRMPTFFFYVNTPVPEASDICTIVARRKHIFHPGPHASLRGRRMNFPSIQGGWHYSYCGNADFVKSKIAAFAHQELNTQKNIEAVEDAVENLYVWWNPNQKFHAYPLAEIGGPQYLLDNQDKYSALIRDWR